MKTDPASGPVRFSPEADDSEILAAVERWVDLLAREEYEAAYAFTEHSLEHEATPYRWAPTLIMELIYGYGLIEERNADTEVYKVTPIATAQFLEGYRNTRNQDQGLAGKEDPYAHHHRSGVIVIGNIWYDLPLNGYWSDLTASFDVLRYPDYLTLELQEIHVF